MHRCFVSDDVKNSNEILVSGDEATHILKVLRFKEGDLFEVCDNTGYVGKAEITEIISKSSLKAKINSVELSDKEPYANIIVFQGLSKGTKMDLVIQKATELGANEIIPVKMEYSVVKLNDEAKKTERWQKIAFEAAKQCKRAKAPVVGQPVEFQKALDMMLKSDLAILPYEAQKEGSLKKILCQNKNAKTISYIIGPEGGFSPKEISLADNKGILRVTLGKRILRTETASITMLSVLMYELGEFDK